MVRAIWDEFRSIILGALGIIAAAIIIGNTVPLFSNILTNSINRVSTIENDYWTSTSDAASDITYTSAEYVALNNQLSLLSSKVSGVETNLGNITSTVNGITSDVNDLNNGLASTNTNLTNSVSAINNSLSSTNNILNKTAYNKGWWIGGGAYMASMLSVSPGIYQTNPSNCPGEFWSLVNQYNYASLYGNLQINTPNGYTAITYIDVFGKAFVWSQNQNKWVALN